MCENYFSIVNKDYIHYVRNVFRIINLRTYPQQCIIKLLNVILNLQFQNF